MWFNAAEERGAVEVLSQEGDILLRRITRQITNTDPSTPITVLAASERTAPNFDGLTREYALAEYLDRNWALRPLELLREHGQTTLILEDPGGELLSHLLDEPYGAERFLRLAIDITSAVSKMHQRGLVHKDIKPSNLLVNSRDGKIRLTGFGVASRVPRERQPPEPPGFIAGTLAYMAPEQTGRMNRSIDSRSDLYALGVTFYQMLTGSLPFNAVDAMELIHCHIARQPALLDNLVPSLPPAISAVVDKLLAKAAEDRYQTAAGLKRDLQRCLTDWETRRWVDPFPLGEHDIAGQLLIPEKLYGREREIDTLLAAFDSVMVKGEPELVLVSGYSGIGKSVVVNELHKALILPRGFFASGKFDQYKRDIPYATLAQAFQGIIRQLLSQTESELDKWRDDLHQALGPNGLLISDLIPELRLIIGEQPTVPELPPLEAKLRFQLVFRRFIGVFAQPDHPLALFLDDLQWLDAATLDLIENLLTQPDVRHLLLIGAYRDNEVGPAHLLTHKLEMIRQSGKEARRIVLAPLGTDDLTRLIMDSFHCETGRAGQLAARVSEKTAGNPFFVVQFITTLVDEALIAFDYADARWCWDLGRIDAKGFTDNVVDFLVGRLNLLPILTQEIMQLFACLGHVTDAVTLAMVRATSKEDTNAEIWQAVRAGFVVRLNDGYAFAHDRVREAAYALIPAHVRAAAHLRIGRLMLSQTATDALEDGIFEIVNQLNRGADLIYSPGEREQLAELNLMAGRRAKSSAAYASALAYFTAGAELLSEEDWGHCQALAFALALQRAECEYVTGDLASAQEHLATLYRRARSLTDRAAVTCLRVDLFTNLDRADRAVEIGLECLEHVGIKWPLHPTDDTVAQEYERIWQLLGRRPVEDLVNLPPMTDVDHRATLDVLTSVHAPANFIDGNLLALTIGRMANLSFEHGNADGSCFAYVFLGMILQSRFGNYDAGFRFGKLGVDLVEQGGLDRFKARVYLNFGNAINPWTRHVRTNFDLLRRALNAAQETGDPTFVAYSYANMISTHLAAASLLSEVQREAEIGLAFVQKARFGTAADLILGQLGLIRALRGLTVDLSSFNDDQFDERQFERHLDADPGLAMPACWYWIRKLQGQFYAIDTPSAVAARSKAQTLLWTVPGFLVLADFHFYGALALAAQYEDTSEDKRPELLKALEAHYKELAAWAMRCPENFENRAALVGAEIARIEGSELEAERLYERAIQSARTNGFVNNEAIASELAAGFYASRGFETIAHTYLREARSCYRRWGAEGKVRQLETLYPYLREIEPTHAAAATIATGIDHLDLATVVKVSQALSGETVLGKLVDTLMRLAIEHAGAERGVLLLSRGNTLRQEAEAIVGENSIVVRRPEESAALFPETIVQYVRRVREIVILDDASVHPTHSVDPYVRGRRTRSVMCLPLVNEARINGVLYLENNLTPGVFTSSRATVLKLLALQAAISLENAYLYGDLAQAVERQKQAEAYLAGEKHVLELIASGRPLREVLAALCRFFEEAAPDCHCGIYPIDGRNKTFEFGVAPSLPAGYTQPIEGVLVAADDSPRGRSISQNAQVITEDIESDPRWMEAPCRSHVLEHGLRAVWSTPICSREGPIIGTICVYQQRPGSPSPHHQEVIAHVAHLASIAIERSQAEAALKRSEFYLTQGQRISLTGTFAWEVATDEITFSDQLKRTWELEPFTVVTFDLLRERTHPEDRRMSSVYLDQVRAGFDNPDYELRLKMPDGRVKYLWVCARVVRHDDGRLECLGAIQDITRRRLAEDARDKVRSELAHVSRVVSLGALTASIAHEVNQPLASILTSGETALRWLDQPEPNFEKVQQVLKRVVNDARRAADVIDRVRTMASKGAPRRSEIALADIIKECTVLLHQEFQSKNVSNSLDLASDLPKVMVDRTQLQQVIVNLVINAIQAMTTSEEAHRKIVIRTQQIDAETVRCVVEDSGPGIDAEHLPRLFDSFFTTKETGMGLGLPIARSIIEAHNGLIRADNESTLGGARLIIELPARVP
ncbi:ATP-binding sensor histidine kinase [Bradyrhizobium sp. 164]|uniref:AAA family ATPase n=1 Tax=Bradyrhizobium sp. 164 TaxID=2782637 RepID=UPI001FF8F257|nr:AAA family ATPase [Bradyrhizobium sp. 164]